MNSDLEFDVAIIGGGPAGSTSGTLLRKYNPNLRVGIFEREVFPRDHVGESQLPCIVQVLDEMGCWDKVEAANFPIKIGGTYRWGKRPELWDFEFYPFDKFQDEPRPAKYEGQRLATAFQVDRAIYDKILLDHAEEMGCDVRQGTKIAAINRDGDRVTSLTLDSGKSVTARHYIDASGTSGILRRAMGVDCNYPTSLRNIAIWDYWQNAEWAVKIGGGATRIQVLSLGYGWIWFIPLGPTRTSIGLVIPAEYYKTSGKRPQELYDQALKDESIVAELTKNATSEDKLQTTKDWSFLADRQAGENWFLVGESAGFADPILSAGLSMAHLGGREVSCTILELDRGKTDPKWLREEFSKRQAHRIITHIRFADYWYSANEQLVDLKDFTAKLAHDAGLDLSPESAWDWIARGGFIHEDMQIGTASMSLSAIKRSGQFLRDIAVESPLEKNNVLALDLAGATWKDRARFLGGAVTRDQCYARGERVLPIRDAFEFIVGILQRASKLPDILDLMSSEIDRRRNDPVFMACVPKVPQALDAMILDGWIKASYDPAIPLIPFEDRSKSLRWNTDKPVGS